MQHSRQATPTVGDRRLGWFTLISGNVPSAQPPCWSERLQIFMDAGHKSICDVNALLNCGTVVRTEQAELFGFPNPFIGIAGYAITITIATALISGARTAGWVLDYMNIGRKPHTAPCILGSGTKRPSKSMLFAFSA